VFYSLSRMSRPRPYSVTYRTIMIMKTRAAKKPYARPKLTQLTLEEAKLLLQTQAEQGHLEAKELLDLKS
jgi:hypothetical protein